MPRTRALSATCSCLPASLDFRRPILRHDVTQVEWIEGRAEFGAVSASWEALLDDHPFSDHAWLAAWYDAFGGTPRVALAWRGDELAAAFPLVARGGRLLAAANYHTPIFSVPAADEAARAAVVEAAVQSRSGDLFVHALAAPGATLGALRRAAARQRRLVLEEPVHSSPIVDTSGDVDAWRQARGATLLRRRRKLEREHSVQLRFTGDDAELAKGFELEGSGWKARKGTAIVSRRETRAFYTALAGAYAARGELAQGWLDVDGVPVAWLLALRRRQRLFLLKTGYAESAGALAPGRVLHLLTAERCFAEGFSAYELLGDAERWKLELANGVREHRRLWAWRRRPVGFAHYAARRWGVPRIRARRTAG